MRNQFGGKLALVENGRRVFAPWHLIDDDIIAVFDQMHLNVPSVRDCMEQVVSHLGKHLGDRKLIYRDHEGRYDHVILRNGAFFDYARFDTFEMSEAIDLLRQSK